MTRSAWRRSSVFDLVLALVVALYGVGDSLTFTGQPDNLLGADRTVMAVGAGLGSFALLFRRRWPIAVAIVSVAVHFLVCAPFLLVAALFSAGQYGRSWSRVAGVCGLSVVMQLAVVLCFYGPSLDRALVMVMLCVGAVVAGLMFRDYQRSRMELLEAGKARARLDERARIAREMHDVVAHRVSLIVVDAGALEVSPDRDPAWVSKMAGQIRGTGRTALEELREILCVLTPSREAAVADAPRDPGPGLGAIPALVDSYGRRGIRIGLTTSGLQRPVSGRAEAAAYRIVQEALTNVIKHAPGAEVQVIVEFFDDRLEVKVVNGAACGVAHPDPFPGSGRGLVGLSERVTLAGGSFTAGPLPDDGFRVAATLPLAD
ncbi:sensor histidine kinase [Actinomadura barringtoniae]|uniref:histidine kinase n=1 Tax=Actinomadura barringtoniae TaxID=1427535 RepID=A0A939PBN5_9ACTN|nr:sensor histidine kinase [Actinomadura barringtoniae]MBO2446654.1 sensor histidine kinase [Actinomadura barringtoniae]